MCNAGSNSSAVSGIGPKECSAVISSNFTRALGYIQLQSQYPLSSSSDINSRINCMLWYVMYLTYILTRSIFPHNILPLFVSTSHTHIIIGILVGRAW